MVDNIHKSSGEKGSKHFVFLQIGEKTNAQLRYNTNLISIILNETMTLKTTIILSTGEDGLSLDDHSHYNFQFPNQHR